MIKVVHDAEAANDGVTNAGTDAGGGSLLDEIVRDGAQRMRAAVLQAEFADYVD